MSTPSDQAKLKAKPKHQARERIATLVSLSPSFDGDPAQASDLGMLLVPQHEFDRLDSEVYLDVVYALQSRGLIFGEKEFQSLRGRYLNSPQYQEVKNDKAALVAGFIDYMLQAELEAYVDQSNDPAKGHSALYGRLLAFMQQPAGTPLHPELKADIQEHQKVVKHRELRTQIEFFQQAKQEVPKQFIERAQQKYPNWSEKQPLPNVNLKKRSKTSVVIDVEDLGVDLDQLLDVMNQATDKIDLKTEGCHEKDNPFRAILFEKDGKYYTVGAAYDKDGVFKVHAYECDEQGGSISTEIADPAGWMGMNVTRPSGPEGMDVSDAVADALTKLAHYSKQEELVADLAVAGEVEVKAGIAKKVVRDARNKDTEKVNESVKVESKNKADTMESKPEEINFETAESGQAEMSAGGVARKIVRDAKNQESKAPTPISETEVGGKAKKIIEEKAPELIKQAKQSQQELKTDFIEGKKERSQVMDPDAKDTDDINVAKSKEKYKFQNSPRIVNLAKKISFPKSEVAKENLAVKRGHAGRRKQLTHNIVVKEAISSAKITENEAVATITKLLKLPVSEIKKTFQEHAQLTDLEFNRLLNRFERMDQPEKEKAIMESSSYPEDALVRGAVRHDTANKYPNRPAKQGDWLGREILLTVAEKYGNEPPVAEVKAQAAAVDSVAKDAKVSAPLMDSEKKNTVQAEIKSPAVEVKPPIEEVKAQVSAVDTTAKDAKVNAPAADVKKKVQAEMKPPTTEPKESKVGTVEDDRKAAMQNVQGFFKAFSPSSSTDAQAIGDNKEKVPKKEVAESLKAASAALAKDLNLSGMNKKPTEKKQEQMEIKSDEALVDNAPEMIPNDMGPPPPPPPPPTKFGKIATSNREALENNMQEQIGQKKSNVKGSIPQQSDEQKALLQTITDSLVTRRQVIDEDEEDKNDNDDDFWADKKPK